MYNLPPELIGEIFKYLPLNSLLNCKSVNKNWYIIVKNNFKLTKLAIKDSWFLKENWFPDYQPIKIQHQIKIKNIDTFNYQLKDNCQFQKLKSLFIFLTKQSNIVLSNLIDELIELENLNIIGLKLSNQIDFINLKNLKNIYICSSEFKKLVINTPNLINLKLKDHWRLNLIIKYSKSLKSLSIDEHYCYYIENYINLEYLYVKSIYDMNQNFLNKLPYLKELHLESNDLYLYEDLLELKESNRRIDLKIFIFGINLDQLDSKIDLLDNCLNDINRYHIKLFKEYSTRLANRLYFHSLCYNDLEDIYNNQIPFNLINKFNCLEVLIIKGNVKYEDQLINIIKFVSNKIKTIEIESILDQHFFDLLPKLIPILEYLIIKGRQKIIDFSFLLKFDLICGVDLNLNVPKKVVNEFQIKYKDVFKYFNYKENDINPIKITKTNSLIFECRTEIKNDDTIDENLIDDLNLNQLFR